MNLPDSATQVVSKRTSTLFPVKSRPVIPIFNQVLALFKLLKPYLKNLLFKNISCTSLNSFRPYFHHCLSSRVHYCKDHFRNRFFVCSSQTWFTYIYSQNLHVHNLSNSLIFIAWQLNTAKFYNLHINNVLGSWPNPSFWTKLLCNTNKKKTLFKKIMCLP